ncbi:MAG: 4Fe-4S dicluster domain-containing protein [Limnochordaceae bacterium]|nr:4Fe-4S dicluster domain-containing protein [Limnochordaceae bacterium]
MSPPAQIATAVRVADEASWGQLLRALAQTYDIWAPVAEKNRVILRCLSPDELDQVKLDAPPTLLPAKKVYRAPEETLLRFRKGEVEPLGNGQHPWALVGIHPCDLRAIQLLDRVYTGFFADERYSHRRQQNFLVVANCLQPFPHCFCTSFQSGPFARKEYDLAVTPLFGRHLVQAGSAAGEAFLRVLGLPETTGSELAELVAAQAQAEQAVTRKVNTDNLPRLLNMNVDHPVWDQIADRCLSCGACTAVCPTCYCFSVQDRLNLDLQSGERRMAWTSCLIMEFSRVALGHNPRHERVARVKQRLYHKFSYFNDQYGQFGCVGCGRCVDTCVAGIDPVEVLAQLRR